LLLESVLYINAAVNIEVAGGHSATSKNERRGKHKTNLLAAPDEALTAFKPVQLSLF